MAEYNSKLHQLETFWAQRSRVQWLKLGDKNTKYFHTIAKLHIRHNYFHELQRPDGSIVSSLKDMYETAQSFFQNLFSNPGNAFPLMTYNLPTKLSSEDNQFLTSVPHESEIRHAVFQINPNKAPDPDGYSAKFYQFFWKELKLDIIRFVQDLLFMGS